MPCVRVDLLHSRQTSSAKNSQHARAHTGRPLQPRIRRKNQIAGYLSSLLPRFFTAFFFCSFRFSFPLHTTLPIFLLGEMPVCLSACTASSHSWRTSRLLHSFKASILFVFSCPYSSRVFSKLNQQDIQIQSRNIFLDQRTDTCVHTHSYNKCIQTKRSQMHAERCK